MQSTFNAGLAYAEYRQRKAAYITSAIVAFTMSSYFVVGYLAGDLAFWDWDLSQTMNGLVGIGICGVMTAYQFILYAQGDTQGGKKVTIVALCVAVGFSLLSEVGQGMERDHVRMETKSLQSQTYQAIVGSLGAGTAAYPYSSQLADAEMKLARCKSKVASGEWNDCVESTARVSSVKSSIQEYYQQNEKTSLSMANTAKKMEKDETNYHPLVNLIRGAINSTGTVASFILSLVLISFFEYAFHYLGGQLAQARALLLRNGYDVTRRERKTPLALMPTRPTLGTDQGGAGGLAGRTSQLGIPSDQAPLDGVLKAVSEALYGDWLSAISKGECSHAKAATQKFIWKHSGTEAETLTANETARIWKHWQNKAANDGILTANPEYREGNRKPEYILN